MRTLKSLLIAIAILLLTQTAHADYIRRQEVALTHGSNNAVRSLPYATITVYSAGTTSLVQIWSDAGTTLKSNPFTTDQYGNYYYYTATGIYDEKIEKTGYTTQYNYDISVGAVIESYYAVSSGTNTLTLSIATDFTSTAGRPVYFKSSATNTGSVVININGSGNKSIKKQATSELSAGDIVSNAIYVISYDGTSYQLLNPSIATNSSNAVNATSATTANRLTDGTNNIRIKKIDIGDWNMDSTSQVSIPHGLTFSNIIGAMAFIKNDVGTQVSSFPTSEDYMYVNGTIFWGSSNVVLTRFATGPYDGTGYDSTSYNRGYILMFYTE